MHRHRVVPVGKLWWRLR